MYYPADNQVMSAGDFTVSSFKMDEQIDNCVLRRLELENKKVRSIKSKVQTQNIFLSCGTSIVVVAMKFYQR